MNLFNSLFPFPLLFFFLSYSFSTLIAGNLIVLAAVTKEVVSEALQWKYHITV